MQLAKNPVFHARTKQIELHYHFVREWVLSGEVELRYVRTDRQVADIFTKALSIQHLDMSHLRGRAIDDKTKKEPIDKGKGRAKGRGESTKEVEKPGRAKEDGRVNDRAGRKKKVRIKT